MTKEEIEKLAEKIVSGTATTEEIIQYNSMCDFVESIGREAIEISAVEQEELGKAVKRNIFHKAGIRKVYRLNWVRWTAVAASVLLVVVLGRMVFFDQKATAPLARNAGKRTDSLAFVWHHEVNTTAKEKRIQLPDGSLITLAKNSEIIYREPFAVQRNVALSGKADFKVRHDQARLFTVASGDLVTTDLGTEFTVSAFSTHRISVRLYDGKVVVKAADKTNKWMNKDVYLLPGQELVYSSGTAAKVRTFETGNASSKQTVARERPRDNPLIPSDDGSWFMFNNQSLDQVFDQLAALYNVRIIYNKKDVQKIYFTSKYDQYVPLETILKQICTPNRLTITRQDAAFIISR